MTEPQAIVYTRAGCHLCDDAIALLRRYQIEPQTIDIDAAPELQSRYTNCVPVVFIDGKERFRGKIDERLLARLLIHRPADA